MSEKILLVVLIAVLVTFAGGPAYAQMVAGINSYPGLYVGYKVENIVVFTGLRFMHASYFEETVPSWTDTTYTIDESWFSISPQIGLKATIVKKQLSPFLRISVGKEIPLTTSSQGTVDIGVDEDTLKDMHDDYFFTAGIGGEYELSKNVGISAEYGLYAFLREYDRETPDYTKHTETNTYQLFAEFGLHYYF